MKQGFDGEAVGQTQTYEWFKNWKNSRTSVEDDECYWQTIHYIYTVSYTHLIVMVCQYTVTIFSVVKNPGYDHHFHN